MLQNKLQPSLSVLVCDHAVFILFFFYGFINQSLLKDIIWFETETSEERALLKFPRYSGVIEVKSPIWQFSPVSVMADSCTASSKIHRFCFLSFYLERVEEDGAV